MRYSKVFKSRSSNGSKNPKESKMPKTPRLPDLGPKFGNSKPLDQLDDLLEPDWDEPSTTVNIHIPTVPHSISEGLKHVNKKKAGIGAGIVAVVAALVEIARQLGWFQ